MWCPIESGKPNCRPAPSQCFPAKAGTQSGLPPSQENKEWSAAVRRLRHRLREWRAGTYPNRSTTPAKAEAQLERLQ